MARMGKCHMCSLFFALFLILVSLALVVTSVVTDYWYKVDGSEITDNATEKRQFSYNFGMWRRCYHLGIPEDEPPENRQGDCVFTHKELVRQPVDSADEKYLHLERCWVAFMVTSAGVQLFTILSMICGLWPGDCHTVRRSSLYLIAALGSLLAAMCGIVSGICFIALRDLDATSRAIYPENVVNTYQWSFMLGWIGTGLCLIEGFLFLCILKMDYDDVTETGKYYQTM